MSGKLVHLTLCVALLGAVSACQKRENAGCQSVRSTADARLATYRGFSYMADNAVMRDLSIADFHFVPHTTELNGTGVARLDRLAGILKVYGGTVRYETFSTDSQLLDQRMAHACEYLALTGCDMERVQIETKLSGGRGLSAEDAIKIKKRGTGTSSSSSSSAGGMSALLGSTSK